MTVKQTRPAGRAAGLAFLLAALTLAVYLPVLQAGFVNIDDATYVTGNAHLRGGIAAGVAWAFTSLGYAGNWHPLTWLSHLLDVRLFGLRPPGHHLVSLLLHAAAAVLLFLAWRGMTGAAGPAFLVAALFALHPLHVESVAWVAERKDVLLGFCWMLVLLSYLRYVRKPSAARLAAVAVLYAFALMAKPMGVTLPLVLFLLDWWPLGRMTGSRPPASSPGRLALEKWPLLALAAASGMVTLLAQGRGGSLIDPRKIGWSLRCANAAVSYAVYLGKTFLPVRLAVFYPFPEAGLPAWQVGGAVLLLGGTTTLALLGARRRPALAVGWLWYLLTLLPVIGLVQVGSQARANRYTYLPLVGIFMVPGAAAGWLAGSPRGRRAVATAAALALLGLGWATWIQAGHWRDSPALFSHALAVTRNNWLAENNLGAALADTGRDAEAEEHYRRALALKPQYPEAQQNLATLLLKKGDLDGAADHYRQAVRLKPDYAKAHNNLGTVLVRQGRTVEALESFQAAVRADPDDADAHFNLAATLEGMGRSPEASYHYGEALRLNSGDAEARSRLTGNAGTTQGRER